MKKWFVATLMTVGMFAASAGARGTPAAAADEGPPEIGTCRYDCASTGVSYRTRAACQAACADFCEPIC